MMGYRIRDILPVLSTILIVIATLLIPFQKASAERKGTFFGSWTASGKWQPLDFLEGREVFTFKLAGHVNLGNDLGEVKDFWSDCAGLWDSETGGTARCVWHDPDGKGAAYIVLNGQLVKKDVEMIAEFVGGAGSLKDLEGNFSFTWSSLFRDRDEGVLSGFSMDLEGSYKVP
jgi:hypothetical protein